MGSFFIKFVYGGPAAYPVLNMVLTFFFFSFFNFFFSLVFNLGFFLSSRLPFLFLPLSPMFNAPCLTAPLELIVRYAH